MRRVLTWFLLGLVGAGALLGLALGLSEAPGPVTSDRGVRFEVTASSPVEAAVSWFDAINRKDLRRARAAFVPADVDQMEWSHGTTSGWATFSDLHCRTTDKSATTAVVQCRFVVPQARDVGNPDTFWDVYFVWNAARHRWLITNYGQG